MIKLKRLQKEHAICGCEENFTNYCFRYGTIIKEFRNNFERETFFIVDSIITSIVMQQGKTIITRIHN